MTWDPIVATFAGMFLGYLFCELRWRFLKDVAAKLSGKTDESFHLSDTVHQIIAYCVPLTIVLCTLIIGLIYYHTQTGSREQQIEQKMRSSGHVWVSPYHVAGHWKKASEVGRRE